MTIASQTRFADLHLHTHFSDGTYSPEELATEGSRHGLSAMALTDHDTVEGCPRMRAACVERGIEFVSASELTAEFSGNELHLIGYFLDTTNPLLLSEMARFQAVRQNRIREMVERLNQMGVQLEAEAVFRLANCRAPGRPHVGRALVQAGICATLDEAFDRFLKKNRPAWVPKAKMSAEEAVQLIHQAGGLAVMAHPGLNRTDDVIPPLVEMGMDGLECFHTKHSTSTTQHYLMMAEQHGLLVTGGSDCHGMSKGKPLIGSVKLPYECFRKLKTAVPEHARPLDPVT
jgi:predicted metal-dependent phosphoesterase TrpH